MKAGKKIITLVTLFASIFIGIYLFLKIIVDHATITCYISCMANYKSLGKILASLHRYTQIYLGEALKKYDLHGSGQTRIVLTIKNEHEGISQEELAGKLEVDKASISRMIRPLIDNGVIIRERNPDDKRAYILKLSKKTVKDLPAIRKAAYRWTGILSSEMEAEELDKFFLLLEKAEENARVFLKGEKN